MSFYFKFISYILQRNIKCIYGYNICSQNKQRLNESKTLVFMKVYSSGMLRTFIFPRNNRCW